MLNMNVTQTFLYISLWGAMKKQDKVFNLNVNYECHPNVLYIFLSEELRKKNFYNLNVNYESHPNVSYIFHNEELRKNKIKFLILMLIMNITLTFCIYFIMKS